MLPLWWPRSACIYCGARLEHDSRSRWARLRGRVRPSLLACPSHRDLVALDPMYGAVPLDPHLQP